MTLTYAQISQDLFTFAEPHPRLSALPRAHSRAYPQLNIVDTTCRPSVCSGNYYRKFSWFLTHHHQSPFRALGRRYGHRVTVAMVRPCLPCQAHQLVTGSAAVLRQVRNLSLIPYPQAPQWSPQGVPFTRHALGRLITPPARRPLTSTCIGIVTAINASFFHSFLHPAL